MRKVFIALSLYILTTTSALADNALSTIPNAQKVGEGRLSRVFWDIYDATLYAPHGKWSNNPPYALSIHYFCEIEGADIAERTINEIRAQGFSDDTSLAAWYSHLQKILPDVKNGSELTAIFTEKHSTVFYQDGIRIGEISDREFGKYFFDIWLSEKTSEPKLRKKLLGLS